MRRAFRWLREPDRDDDGYVIPGEWLGRLGVVLGAMAFGCMVGVVILEAIKFYWHIP